MSWAWFGDELTMSEGLCLPRIGMLKSSLHILCVAEFGPRNSAAQFFLNFGAMAITGRLSNCFRIGALRGEAPFGSSRLVDYMATGHLFSKHEPCEKLRLR